MKLKPLFCTVAIFLSFLTFACEPINKLTATKIKDILDQPRKYEDKEVTVYGTVTNAVSLLVVKYFELQDDTATIKGRDR